MSEYALTTEAPQRLRERGARGREAQRRGGGARSRGGDERSEDAASHQSVPLL